MAKRRKKSAKADITPKESSVSEKQRPDPTAPVSAAKYQREYLVQELKFFSGPLPPPDVFAKYKAIDPEIVRVILHLAENEQKHRQNIEDKLTDADIRSHFRGQGFAALISTLLIGSLTFLFATDHTWEAAGLGAGGFVSIILAFLRHRFIGPATENQEHREKNDHLAENRNRSLEE